MRHIPARARRRSKGANPSIQNFNQSQYTQGEWLARGQQLGPLHQTPLHLALEAEEEELAALLLE